MRGRRLVVALILTFALRAYAPAQSADIRFSTPPGNGPVSLAVVELGTIRLVTLLPPLAEPGGVYLGGSLWEHREARFLLVLSGPRVPQRARVRRLGLDTGPRAYGGRRLVFLERTDTGYLAQWDTEIRRGRACLPNDVVVRFHLEARPSEPGEPGGICFAA